MKIICKVRKYGSGKGMFHIITIPINYIKKGYVVPGKIYTFDILNPEKIDEVKD